MNDPRSLAARLSLVSATLFVALVVVQVTTGASQHFFEVVHAPEEFARQLLARAAWLEPVFVADDVFIGCYVLATWFLARALREEPLGWVVFALVAAAGLLDLEENHHLLALLAAARAGLVPEPAELVRRMDWSSVKWALAHVAFFALGLAWPARERGARLVRALGLLQLPVGLAGVVYGDVRWLALLRAFNLAAGFLALAWLLREPRGAAGSGAPASPPGTRPAAVG